MDVVSKEFKNIIDSNKEVEVTAANKKSDNSNTINHF